MSFAVCSPQGTRASGYTALIQQNCVTNLSSVVPLLIHATGAVAAVEALIDTRATAAAKALDRAHLPAQPTQALQDLIHPALQRDR